MRAGVRVACAAALGVVVGVVSSGFTAWQAAMLVGWDAGALLLILWIWMAVAGLDAEESRTHASREDTSIRLSELVILSSGVALLAAVGLVLIRAGHATGGAKAYLITLGVLSVALTWMLVHTVFTLRYARTYYAEPVGGIDFNEEDPPTHLSGLRLLGAHHWHDLSGLRYKSHDQEHPTDSSCPCPALLYLWCGDRCTGH